eukprot:2810912-Prymnesium_polylepis.1
MSLLAAQRSLPSPRRFFTAGEWGLKVMQSKARMARSPRAANSARSAEAGSERRRGREWMVRWVLGELETGGLTGNRLENHVRGWRREGLP